MITTLGTIALTAALIVPTTTDSGKVQPHPEWQRAHSAAADDRRGYMPSLYRGLYYHPDQESFRRCVADREGSFTYMVIGGGGDQYHGTYQFHNANWRDGLVWMMLAESKRTDDGLREKLKTLFQRPIHKWSRYFQDRAFYTALNVRGKWAGAHHWNGGNYRC